MSIIGSKTMRCHGHLKRVKIHRGEHGKRFYMKRKSGGGTRRVYIK